MSSFTTMFHVATLFRASHSTKLAVCVNQFHTSFITYLDQGWRQWKGLRENPIGTGPLTNLPDYSFKDKRPSAYGSRQLQRIQKHQQFVKKIVKLVGEVDHAVERHANLMKEKEKERQKILESKLKPKGQELIASD